MRTFALFPDLHGIPRGKLFDGPPGPVALSACRGVLAKDLFGRPVLFDSYARPAGASDVDTSGVGGREFFAKRRSTVAPLPFGADAIAIRSLVDDDGAIHPLDTRARLRDYLGSNELASSMRVGAELEFSLLSIDGSAMPIDGQAYGSAGLAAREAYLSDVLDALDAYGVGWNAASQENEMDQYEIALDYTDPLAQADRVLLARLICRALAPRHGLVCTFAPVLALDRAPSSLHVHLSCSSLEVLESEPGPLIAGPLAHLNELLAVLMPSALSRRVDDIDSFSSDRLDYGEGDRFRTMRVMGDGAARRVECRTPTGEANPYLVVLGLVASVATAAANGEFTQPPSMESRIEYGSDESLERFGGSALARRVFGTALVQHFVDVKRCEFVHAPGRDIELESRALARIL